MRSQTLQLTRLPAGLRTQRLLRTLRAQPPNRHLGMLQARARRREVLPVVQQPVATLREGLLVVVVRVDCLEAEALVPGKATIVIQLAQGCPRWCNLVLLRLEITIKPGCFRDPY